MDLTDPPKPPHVTLRFAEGLDAIPGLDDLRLYAWVGEDELDERVGLGIKQGLVPAGYIPLVSVHLDKIRRDGLVEGLRAIVREYGKPMVLVRLRVEAVEMTVEPEGGRP